MFVTLITDASWCSESYAAGWGAWCKSDRGTAKGSGPIEEPCLSANMAEIRALRYGLRLAARNGVLKPNDTILWQCDSEHALRLFETHAIRTCNRMEIQAHDETRKALAAWGNKLRIRHLKARSHDGTTRSSVHTLCDKLAREAMRSDRPGSAARRKRQGIKKGQLNA